jgi:uncharacterized protein
VSAIPEPARTAGPAPPTADPDGLVGTTVRFARALREQGLAVSPVEARDAVRALDAVDVSDPREVYVALRAVLAGRVEDFPVFDRLFHALWSPAPPAADHAPEPLLLAPPPPRRRAGVSLDRWMRPDAAEEEAEGVPLPGEDEVLETRDFSTFGSAELAEIDRVAASLARRLAARPSRRWRAVRRGQRIHPRRTLRRAFRTGGDAVQLSYRERIPKRTTLVLLCDVSGSMDLYSRLLLQFVYAMQRHFRRVESFVFSTRLGRVTEQLRGDDYRAALARLSTEAHGWSGGTRIGESLAAFNRGWPRLLDRRTVVVILSDGWDTGDPAELSAAMSTIHRRAGKTVWLNPLAGSPGYQPLTRGMQAALPHVDVFAPAHNLASLRALVRHLVL